MIRIIRRTLLAAAGIALASAPIAPAHAATITIVNVDVGTGLGFDDPNGGLSMSRALYETGLWAMFAGFDRRYLQFKAGLLVDRAYLDEAFEKLDTALARTAG